MFLTNLDVRAWSVLFAVMPITVTCSLWATSRCGRFPSRAALFHRSELWRQIHDWM